MFGLVNIFKVASKPAENNDVVFMDVSKAFDCIPHSLLIEKLHAYGVDWYDRELLTDYLRLISLNRFVNDLFLFIEKCTLYNYGDDNSMSHSWLN